MIDNDVKITPYKEEILLIFVGQDVRHELDIWMTKLENSGWAMPEIVDLLHQLYSFIMYHLQTKDDDSLTDVLDDFIETYKPD